MPDNARRTATGLLFLTGKNASGGRRSTDVSDRWHARLMEEGWKSWTQ